MKLWKCPCSRHRDGNMLQMPADIRYGKGKISKEMLLLKIVCKVCWEEIEGHHYADYSEHCFDHAVAISAFSRYNQESITFRESLEADSTLTASWASSAKARHLAHPRRRANFV